MPRITINCLSTRFGAVSIWRNNVRDFMTPIIELNGDMQRMSLPEIESAFSLLIVAASETTATTLSGVTNYLIQTPPVMQSLVTEIRGAFKTEQDINMDSLRELPYLGAVISEGLRLCNPLPVGLPRLVPPEGDTVCGQWLPGKVSSSLVPSLQLSLLTPAFIVQTHVSVQPKTIHNSPKRFHRPESFVPERWLSRPSCPTDRASDQLSAVLPFGLGPRRCMGRTLAMFEMRLILARLLWAFDIEAVPGSVLDWRTLRLFSNVALQPFMVRLKDRVGNEC